jgi:hypothetical protein
MDVQSLPSLAALALSGSTMPRRAPTLLPFHIRISARTTVEFLKGVFQQPVRVGCFHDDACERVVVWLVLLRV